MLREAVLVGVSVVVNPITAIFTPFFVTSDHGFAQSGRAMSLVSEIEFAALLFQRHAQHRLAKTDPSRGVSLLAHQVVPFGREPHR